MSKTDPPEDIEDFFHRFMETPGVQNDMWANWYEFGLPEYQQQEREKLEYRKQLEKEAKEHESTVDRLAAQIEREKIRIHREEARKREREEREKKREEDAAARKEEADPTPKVGTASTIPVIPFSIRDQHVFVPGMTRHGKSTQLFHLILDDINNDRGVAVLDPIKADLITELLPYIPERRLKDCIYLDLNNPIPLDVMRPTPQPEQLVGDIKALILKGRTDLSRAEPILTRFLYALLSLPGSKFTDVEDVFTLPGRKEWFLNSLKQHDERRFQYWTANWPPSNHLDPLISRMTDFTENPSLRTILGEPYPKLNLRTAMDESKIILVSLPGNSEITQIYGTLLISRFQQAAFSRSNIPKNERVPFCLYVDEFEVFQTSSFAKILAAAGGLKLYLTVGNQHASQLSDEIRREIFGNVKNFIMFTIGEASDLYSRVIYPYNLYRLEQMPRHQAVYKIGDNPPEFHWTKPAPHGAELPEALQQRSDQIRQLLIKHTYAQYGTIRTGDKSSLLSRQVPQDEVNEQGQHKSEAIAPSGSARIQMDDGKTKSP